MFLRSRFCVLLTACVLSIGLAGCAYDKPVAVDFSDLHANIPHSSKELQMSTPSSIPYCCTSVKSKNACHAYNCGNSTRGCVKWCANN